MVDDAISQNEAQNDAGAVGHLLKHNPLARAVWAFCNRPGWGMKEAFRNQQPLPIKEPPDEEVADECEGSSLVLPSSTKLGPAPNLRKVSPKSQQNNDDSKLREVIELLHEVLDITTEQSEIISKEMTEAESKENDIEKQQNEQRSNVSRNVPKIPFTKNKILRKMQSNNGNLVMYAHDNFALVANMMIGIKKAVDSVLEYPEVHAEDFKIVSKFYIVPWAVLNDRENTTKFKNCKFIDYAPQVFYNIRRIFRVKTQEYTRALGPQQLLAAYRGNFMGFTELASTGKSGSFFYYSYDSKYILKTVSEEEFHFLRRILPAYYEHVKNHPNTLMTRFYGCHKIIFYRSGIGRCKEFRFVIMNNVFSTGQRIHARYDVKGSTVGRQVLNNPNEKIDPTIARKELDLKNEGRKFFLEKEQRKQLLETIRQDCIFFERNAINDYSLLIGVHRLEAGEVARPSLQNVGTGANPARSSSSAGFMDFFAGIKPREGNEEYYIGIIDILTEYTTRKKMEHFCKSIKYGDTMSCIPPVPYSKRFQNYIASIIVEVN